MTELEIIDLFIRAAAIDQKLPNDAKPKKLRGQRLPGMSPLTEDEQKGWLHPPTEDVVLKRQGKKVRISKASQIHKTDKGPINEWWMAFYERDEISHKDVSDWELAMNLIALSASPENRRCLWAWSRAKAGCLYVPIKNKHGTVRPENVSFAKWCRLEGIHEETGRRRKTRAIEIIHQHLVRGEALNDEMWDFTLLPVGPIFEHISDTVGAGAVSEEGRRHLMQDDAFAPFIVPDDGAFDWAEARNERRRQKYAERRKAA